MIMENNKMAIRYHREMSLCNFQLGFAHQQLSIGSTNISSTCTSGNDENTCSKKCVINWEATLHDNNAKKSYTRYYVIILHKYIKIINVYFR